MTEPEPGAAERIITAPLGVYGGLTFSELSAIVGADALARHRGLGAQDVVLPLLTGDHAAHLARERSGRATADFDAAREQSAIDTLAALGVDAMLPTRATDEIGARAAEAAVVAFVRLYEEGLVDEVDAVVAECPSCATVIEGPDSLPGFVEADVLHVVIDEETDLIVRVVAPELIEGAVAIAVPLGDEHASMEVVLPLVGRRVPVIEETGRIEAGLVVPAHDVDAYELALLHGLVPLHVFDRHGTRYAARQVARELLEAEGVVREIEPGEEAVERCRHCGSIAVHVLGRHWMLRGGALEVGAGDAVRDGHVTFVPSDARDTFVSGTTSGRPWCLDRRLPGGVPLPVASCEECGRSSIEVTPSTRCGKCLGRLQRDGAVTLDARFVAALWPLALAGWPFPVRFVKTFPSLRRKSLHKTEETRVTAVVPPEMLSCWLLPAIALARHFTGDAPLSAVVVQPPAEPSLEVDLEEFLGDVNEATRLALLSGDPTVTVDLDAVAPFWVSFRGVPPRKETQNDEEEVEAALRALEDAGPAQAAALFIAALGGGLSARARARAVPFLGAAESGT